MASVLKIGINSFLGAGAIGGAVYGFYEYSRETIKDKLKGTLLTKSTDDSTKWTERAKTLNADNTDLTSELKEIKNNEKELQKWCDKNLKTKFSSENDKLFKEIEKYCTYNIKDKVGKVIEENAWDNNAHNKKLEAFTESEGKKLSKEMKKIQAELKKSTGGDKEALKKWCKGAYTKPYKGEKDQDFLDTKEYCKA